MPEPAAAPPPQALLDLVARFDRNRDAYKSHAYNETQVRREFIDPLFKALGWDIDNELGYAEAYKDVIHEDAIKVGGATKAPDYCFRIGGTRKFFLEAKKPAVGIHDDREPAYQLRRYAWSARLPLSVLTDFEELAVYDCRIRPNQNDPASRARTLYFTCDEYAARWDELSGLLGKQAVLRGSFDKYVESAKKKRGTAEVDAEILKEIEGWRHILARNFALRNDNLGVRDINFAVTRTIDRILFLRMCEDRGIEPYGRLRQLLNGDAVYERLGAVFREADDRYNSSLFYFRQEKGREPPDELTLALRLDDIVLKAILKKLYYPESPYEFSVLPTEILGQVYEQFLGKVIRLTAAGQAKVEEKPEVRKAGGVYYTPTYIVDYIVKHTVGELLKDKTPADIAPPPEGPRKGRRGGRSPRAKAASPAVLRILDPACGSGSFLLGAYQFLLDWHRDWYAARIEGEETPPDEPSSDDQEAPQQSRARREAGLTEENCALADQPRDPENAPQQSRARKEAGLAAGNAADDSGAGLRARESAAADPSRARQEATTDPEEAAQPSRARKEAGTTAADSAVADSFPDRGDAPQQSRACKQAGLSTDDPSASSPLPHGRGSAGSVHSRTTPPPSPALQPATPPSPGLQPATPPSPGLQAGLWSDRIYRGAGGQWRLTIQEKKRILLNHIHGVDIDPQAVEVTKLSLLLKVLENETAETIGSNLRLFHERALPDLDRNIKCGNSLIGPDFYEGRQFDMFDEEQRYRINAFDWKAEFPDAFAGDNPGFDAVIGNPPWLMAGYYLPDTIDELRERYITARGKFDLYYVFLERVLEALVSARGFAGLIVPNKFLHTKAAAELRRLMATRGTLRRLIDFGVARVFSGATNYSCVLIFGPTSSPTVSVSRSLADLRVTESFDVQVSSLGAEPWSLQDDSLSRLFAKMRDIGEELDAMTRRFGTGVQTGVDRVLLLSADEAADSSCCESCRFDASHFQTERTSIAMTAWLR